MIKYLLFYLPFLFTINLYPYSKSFEKKLNTIYQSKEEFNFSKVNDNLEKNLLKILNNLNISRYGNKVDYNYFSTLTDSTIVELEKQLSEKKISKKIFLELNGIIHGFKAYLQKETAFFSPVKNGYKAKSYLEDAYDEYKSEVGYISLSLADIYKTMFFEDSYTVSLFSNGFHEDKNILEILNILEEKSNEKSYFQIELNLLLIEIYADILKLPAKSIDFSQRLVYRYPQNPYFRFLYAKDLYGICSYNKSYEQLSKLFTIYNKKEIYPYLITAMFYRIDCAFILKKEDLKIQDLLKKLEFNDYLTYYSNITNNENSIFFIDNNLLKRDFIGKPDKNFFTQLYKSKQNSDTLPNIENNLLGSLILENLIQKKEFENKRFIYPLSPINSNSQINYAHQLNVFNLIRSLYFNKKYKTAYKYLDNIDLDNFSDKNRLHIWKNIFEDISE